LRCSQAKRITEQDEDSPLSRHNVSLHIPLHRTLSAILQKLVLLPWDNHERGFLSAFLPQDNHDIDKFTEDEVPCCAISVSSFINMLLVQTSTSFLLHLSYSFKLNALGDAFRLMTTYWLPFVRSHSGLSDPCVDIICTQLFLCLMKFLL